MFLCKCTYKPEAMLGSLGYIFLKKAGSFLKGRLTCVLVQQGLLEKQDRSSLELIFFFSVNLHFPERALSRGRMCVWEYGSFGEMFETSDSLGGLFWQICGEI